MGIQEFSTPTTLIGEVSISQSNADAISTPAIGNVSYNGTSWDRVRNNHELTMVPQGIRTAQVVSQIFTNYSGRGVILQIRVISAPEAETLEIRLGFNIGGVNSFTIAKFDPVDSAGNHTLIAYPGASMTPVSTYVQSYAVAVPRKFWTSIIPSGVGEWEYEITAALIV